MAEIAIVLSVLSLCGNVIIWRNCKRMARLIDAELDAHKLVYRINEAVRDGAPLRGWLS